MGKIRDFIQQWLEEYGYSLGYDMNAAPEISDIDVVTNLNIHVWEYFGYENEEQYFNDRFNVHDTEPSWIDDYH